MSLTLELIFIRHGWTAANEGRQFTGWSQVPLSKRGRSELAQKRDRLQMMEPIHAVLASPLRRCIETAHGLFPQFRPFPFPEFAERSFGIFEGKTLEENSRDESFRAWASGEDVWPESIETNEQFSRRIYYGLQRVAKLARVFQELPPQELFSEHVPEGGELVPLVARAALDTTLRFAVISHGGVLSQLARDFEKTKKGPGHYVKNLEAVNFLFTLDEEGLHYVGLRTEENFLPPEV